MKSPTNEKVYTKFQALFSAEKQGKQSLNCYLLILPLVC